MRQLTANVSLSDLIVKGFIRQLNGQINTTKFVLTAKDGRVYVRLHKAKSQAQLVAAFKQLAQALDGYTAEIECLVDIIINRNISTDNPLYKVEKFTTPDQLKSADLPGGDEPFSVGKAAFRIVPKVRK